MGLRHQEADSGLPVRPPACLAMLDKDGEASENLLENLRAEALGVQTRLREQLKQFRTEVDIFLRLMYKNKNQHRHSLYYRRMLQVRRDLRLIDYCALGKTVEDFTRWTFSPKPSRDNVDRRILEKDQMKSALCVFLSATRILNQIDQPILAASTQILGLLSQSFFMALGLTIFSALARLRVLSQQLLFEFATVYNLLSVFSKERLPTTQLLATPVQVSRSRLPLHLECSWDGGKLCITEIQPPPEALDIRAEIVAEAVPLATPLSCGSWFVDDRKSVAVLKNVVTGPPTAGAQVSGAGGVLFADARSGVKYDVRVSPVTAREESSMVAETDLSQGSSIQNDSQGDASAVPTMPESRPSHGSGMSDELWNLVQLDRGFGS